MALVRLSQPLFPAGDIVMTQGVSALIQRGELNPSPYLQRDWGDLCDEDRCTNDDALKQGDRLFSSYRVTPALTIWIITEWNRSVTTLLLPSEY